MAMPWTKAKLKQRQIEQNPAERERLTDLFNQCFRIQREVSEAAGRYVPIIIENVRGAQKWVGKARWNFGSFYLWGDVPALMPIPGKQVLKAGIAHRSNGATNFHGYAKGEGNKTAGLNWSDQSKRGQDFTRIAGQQSEGVKKRDEGYDYEHRTFGWKAPPTSSKSPKRKEASAIIAKIPQGLADWIARCMLPSIKT